MSATSLQVWDRDKPCWSLVFGANTIEPVVSCAKVTAGIPNDGDVEPLQRLQNIRAEAILIGQWVARIINAAIDAASHVPNQVSP